MTILAWASVDGGPWNGDATADPVTGAGGVDLTAIEPNALFPTVHTSGSATHAFNFGQSAFLYSVPTGYTAGWPGTGAGGFTALDPATKTGSSTLSNNNRTFAVTGFGPAGCQALAADGKTTGSYYFEATMTARGGIADFNGTGILRQYPGQSYSNGFDASAPGQYTGITPPFNLGGIVLGSGYPFFAPNPYHNFFGALGALLASSPPTTWFEYQLHSTVRWAITFGFTPPVGNQIDGIGDLWFAPTSTFIDFRASSNRRLFNGTDGSTTFLGNNGELPIDETPPLFLHLIPGDTTAAHFANNYGSGGSFSPSGPPITLFDGSIPPCGAYVIDSPNPPHVQGYDPQVRLSVSDDGGRTFSLLVKPRSLGKIGEYKKRLRWMKMGQFRQRQIRLEITDPVRRNIVGVYIDMTLGLDQ